MNDNNFVSNIVKEIFPRIGGSRSIRFFVLFESTLEDPTLSFLGGPF